MLIDCLNPQMTINLTSLYYEACWLYSRLHNKGIFKAFSFCEAAIFIFDTKYDERQETDIKNNNTGRK